MRFAIRATLALGAGATALGVAGLLLTGPCSPSTSETGRAARAIPPAGWSELAVVRVIDGDTIQVEGGLTVHYQGIDAPGIGGPDEPLECYGVQARERNRELAEGKMAQLERDMAHEDGDGQVLRYVYVDGRMLNEILLREGYARASVHPPDLRYADVLLAAQQEAGELSRGLWGACPASSSD